MRFTEVVPALLIGSTAGCFDYAALQTGEKDLAMPAEADMAVVTPPDLATGGDMATQPPDMVTPPPTTWRLAQTSAKKLNAIAGYDKSNVFAVGDTGTALRWDGTAWASETLPANTTMNAVAAFNDGTNKEVWAGGNGGVVYARSGATWTDKNCDFGINIYAITAAKKNEVLVVGNDKKKGRFYNGTMWAAADSDLNIAPLRAAFSTGGAFFIAGDSGGFAEYQTVPPTGPWGKYREMANKDYFGIWGPAKNNLLVVGQDGVVSQWNGTNILAPTTVDVSNPDTLRAIHGFGSDTKNIYAVGDSAAIYYYNGSTWTRETNSNVAGYTLTGVYAADAANVWAVGYKGNAGAIFKR